MVDIFFKCASCGKHLVVNDSAAGANINCPDCNDIVVIPTLVIPRMCPHCSQELKFASNMTRERVQCSACKADVVLLSALPQNHEANSSAARPTLLAPEGDGSAVKRNIDGVESCPNCVHRIGEHVLVCIGCGYELITGKNAFGKANHGGKRIKRAPRRAYKANPWWKPAVTD
jgi:DNA-directed RNA polymerase subunit RPC12/RpoP